MMALLWIGVFFGAIMIDFADSRNTLAVSEGQAHAAARWSVMMYLIGLVSFFGVLKISWMLVFPEVAGLYVGSWLAVRGHRTSVS